MHGIGFLSVVPLRAEPSDRAEQVSQLVFGECYTVVAREEKWVRVRVAADGYEGWMDAKQHREVPAAFFREWEQAAPHPRALALAAVVGEGGARLPIQIGVVLPFYDGRAVRLGPDLMLAYEGPATDPHVPDKAARIVEVADHYLGAPYQWGGKSVFGIDCSGFTQQVFGMVGIQLPRDASQQVAVGREVHFVTQARAGDMAFFDNAEGRIVHVGLVVSEGQILHASGQVRVDMLDHHGIYNSERRQYTHQLRIIKRVV